MDSHEGCGIGKDTIDVGRRPQANIGARRTYTDHYP
jgi:hypothetical protein